MSVPVLFRRRPSGVRLVIAPRGPAAGEPEPGWRCWPLPVARPAREPEAPAAACAE